MNKTLKILMSFLMAFSMFFVISSSEVEAKEYAFGCDAYELAWVNDAGDFETVACYGTFAEAKAAMTQDDYVVRHPSSKSPTKIIAIKSGIAISYPRRNGSTTLNVYQHQEYVTDKGKYKDTYVTQHRELFQPETVSYNGNGEGNVKLVLQGFEGYAKLSGMDLVPMKFIEKGLVITLGGQTNDNGVPENPFEMIPKMSQYTAVQNGSYKDLVYTYYSGYDGKAYSLTIGPAADWMSVGQTYYSKDGYNFYADAKMSNYLATYYSYYVFLPFRSRSNIQGSTFDAYLAAKGFTEKPTSTSTNDLTERQSQLAGEGQMFVDSQNVYGVNALLTYALACNESGYGRSTYAVSKNNLFGWAAVDSNPDNATQFGSIATGIQEQMAYNLRGYLDIFDVRFFGMHPGNKDSGFNVKYASDPYWGYKIAAIAYDIDKFSKNYDGTLSDCNTYSLGLINEFQTPYYRTASTSSEVMFSSEYSSQYQKNHIVIVNGETNGFYQVQSPNAILPDGTILKNKVSGVQQPSTPYDFARSVGFISADKVTLLNEFNHVTIPGQTPEGEFVFSLSDFSVNDQGILSVSGTAYRPGIYITQTNQMIHSLEVFDEFYDQKLEARMMTALKENTQDQAQFNGTLDLNELEDGKYYFRLNSDYSSFVEYCDTRVINTAASSVETQTKKYSFKVDSDVLWLNVETKEVEIPQIPVLPEESRLVQILEKMEYIADSNILQIYGYAYLTHVNATLDTSVTHLIQIINMETSEIIEIPATTSIYEKGIQLGDGYEYKKIIYDANIDVSSLPLGCYTIRLVVKNGEYEAQSSFLKDQSPLEVPKTKNINGTKIRITKNSVSNYRFELSVEKNEIEFDQLIKKPTLRNSRFVLDDVKLNQDSIVMNGLAWIYNTVFNAESNVNHQLVLIDEAGTAYHFDAQSKACSVNYTQRFNSTFDWSNICFDVNASVKDLPKGRYVMYMDVSSNGNRDIYECDNMYQIPISSTIVDQRTYSILTSKIRNRMILEIK